MLTSQAAESSRALQGLLQSPPKTQGSVWTQDTSCYWCPPAWTRCSCPIRGRTHLPPGRLNFNKSGRNSFHTCGAKQGKVGGVTLRTTTKRWHHLFRFWRMWTGSLMHRNVNKSERRPLLPLSDWIHFYGELAGKGQLLRRSFYFQAERWLIK